MDNRRKEPRKKVVAFTPVYQMKPLGQGPLLGYLGDLTLQGALVIGEKTLEVGQPITLGIEFPDRLPGVAETRMTIPAHVARCVQEEDSPDYRIGFEFTGPTPEQIRIIEALLERYSYRYQ